MRNDKGLVIQIDGISNFVGNLPASWRCCLILIFLNLLRQLRHLLNKRAVSERLLVHNLPVDNARISQPLSHSFGVNGFIRLFFRLQRTNVGKLLLGHIAVMGDHGVNPGCDLCPGKLNYRTVALLQPDALAIMVLDAVIRTGHRMGMTSNAILAFQKVGLFPGGVRGECGKVTVDSTLAARHRTPAGKGRVDLVLGHESGRLCHLGQQGVIDPAGQRKLTERMCNGIRAVEMEAHEFTVLAICISKRFYIGGHSQ